jgi:hypothetical protein
VPAFQIASPSDGAANINLLPRTNTRAIGNAFWPSGSFPSAWRAYCSCGSRGLTEVANK